MNIRRASAAGLIVALAAGGLLTGTAAAASAKPADQREAAAQRAKRVDFAYQGVVIWNEPRAGSHRNGLGYPGQGFDIDRVEEHGLYRCDQGQSTQWSHGRNVATGVVGWVPACNLADPD